MTDTVLIYTTAPSRDVADTLTARLLEQRLAACVNCIDGMRSSYWWEGAIAHADEVVVFIKTTHDKTDAVKAFLTAEHPYDTPCCLVLPVSDGLPDYLDWIARETIS